MRLRCRPQSGETSINAPAVVRIEELLPARIQEIHYAHEIGHIRCGHPGSLRTLDAGDWWRKRDEREASEVAARLLIPLDAIMQGETTEHIAAGCAVPSELVELYPLRVF